MAAAAAAKRAATAADAGGAMGEERPLDLDPEEREELGRILRDNIQSALDARRDVVDRILRGRDQYDAISKPKSFPWAYSANLNVPITRSILDSIHARVLRVMTGVTPFFRITPFSGADVDAANRIEDFLEWQMQTEVNLPEKLDRLVHVALRDGNAIGYAPWVRSVRMTRDRVLPSQELLDAHEWDASSAKRLQRLIADAEATPIEIEREEVLRSGPALKVIDVPNFVLYPHNARSIERAIFVGHRLWANDDDLRRGVRDSLYDETAVEELLEAGGDRPDGNNEYLGGDPDRASDVGIDNWTNLAPEERPFQIFQIVCRYDADDDGIAEDCLFRVEMSTGILLKAAAYPYWHGRRCYINYCPYPRPNMFYGYSVPDILADLSAEVNAIRNQRVDAGTINLSPMVAVRRGVRFDPNKTPWRPGGTVTLDNPESDIKPLFIQANTQSAFAEEAAAREMAERVSGVSDYAQGQSPSRSRTLGEVQAILQEGNLKFDVVIQRLQRANNEFGQQVVGLNRQFLDHETEFALERSGASGVKAPPLFATFSRTDIQRRFGIRAHGNTINSNKELELQVAEKLYMMSERCPLMQRPTRIYAVVQHYLRAMGILNPEPYIGTTEEAAQMEQKALQAPPQAPPPNMSVSGKMGEGETLALLLKSGTLSPEDIEQAAKLLGVLPAQATSMAPPSPARGSAAPAAAPVSSAAPSAAMPGPTAGETSSPPTGGTGSSELDQLLAQVGG